MRKPETKTKIICTLGPASGNKSIIKKMALAGMDAARLNFSHSGHKEHKASIDLIRDINRECGRGIKVLQDLEGYRIRVGGLKGHKPVEVKKNETVILSREDTAGVSGIIPFDYEGPLSDINGAEFIYIDDGNIALKIKKIGKKKIETKAVSAGLVREHKGINMPGAHFKFTGITAKDRSDIAFGIANSVDFIAQSFVRSKKDIFRLKELIGSGLSACSIIAKIENREGIRNIDEIIEASDGIMIARGDMGVSVPIYKIPIIQKMIIKRCNKKRKFVITATQMLESMTENPRPTRAEVTDVANAILDGTDYVMLSGETAVGSRPVETVRMMKDIVTFTEKSRSFISKPADFS
jgi:pyruvate kinase